jgi:hypothetical protein
LSERDHCSDDDGLKGRDEVKRRKRRRRRRRRRGIVSDLGERKRR